MLELPAVSADADFFALGGSSLAALQMVGRLQAEGLAVTVADVVQHPTAQALAERTGRADLRIPRGAAALEKRHEETGR